jgi:long-chain acyl-CoA synthetase
MPESTTGTTATAPGTNFFAWADAVPDRLAIISDTGETISYQALAHRIRLLAGALRKRGLEDGDVVAILSENSPRYLEMTLACRLAGLYFVTVNVNLGADEIVYILRDCGATTLLGSANVAVYAELGPDRLPQVAHRLLQNGSHPDWDDYEAELAAAVPMTEPGELEGDLLQYSSGTTGRPKGIKRELRSADSSGADAFVGLVQLIGVGSGAIFMTPAPLYHTAPVFWTMTVLRLGGTAVLMTKFDPVRSLELIEEHRVSHGQFVPTMFVRMLKLPADIREKFDVSSLRGVVHAAAPCPVEIKRQMLDWWGPLISEYWSSSEGAGFTFLTATEWLAHPGSVGRPLMGPLHICDDEGNELPIGEPGMIWAELQSTYTYLNDPAKTAESTSAQGWRSVGDVGRFDEDGYLYLTDRATFMIISGGVNIYPQESENVLLEHPAVYDAGVIGLPDPDLGEIAVAAVQLVSPEAASPELAVELSDWCQARLARYKCPRRIDFVTDLPRSDTGKLFKRQLKDRYLQAGGPPG